MVVSGTEEAEDVCLQRGSSEDEEEEEEEEPKTRARPFETMEIWARRWASRSSDQTAAARTSVQARF